MPQPSSYRDRLAKKVAIVTGAGSDGDGFGTGKATAIVFSREGARVCLVDHDAERLQQTLRIILSAGGDAFAICGDVTDNADCKRIADEALMRYGRIDILVNNVGTAGPSGNFTTFDEPAWDRTIGVNLKSAVLMARHVVPVMQKSGGGSIVNISSIAGIRAHGGSLAYGPSKAAMAQLSRELAIMYGRDGIRSNTIAPGHILTPMVAALIAAQDRETRRRIGPLGSEGDAWDVAAAALFLASDDARFITGQQIAVDGGVSETAAMTALMLAKTPTSRD